MSIVKKSFEVYQLNGDRYVKYQQTPKYQLDLTDHCQIELDTETIF